MLFRIFVRATKGLFSALAVGVLGTTNLGGFIRAGRVLEGVGENHHLFFLGTVTLDCKHPHLCSPPLTQSFQPQLQQVVPVTMTLPSHYNLTALCLNIFNFL